MESGDKQLLWLRLLGTLHNVYGVFVLVLLPTYVALWSAQGEGAYEAALQRRGYPAGLGPATFFVWIATGVVLLATGRALRRLEPSGRWLACIVAAGLLSDGAFQIANATEDSLDILLFIVFPLLSLFVVNVVAVDYLKPTADS